METLTLLAQTATNPLTSVWLPLLAGIAAVAGIVFAALRFRPEGESRLYGDAMKMVTELKAQLAAETAKRENMELRLVEAQADRHELEQRIVRLYARIEALEAEVGGRRADDG